MLKLFTLLFIVFSLLSYSGSGQWYYRISFTDKSNSPWSLSNPGEYLSERALDRRERQGIIIDSLDLPLNPHYIEQVLKHEVSLINSSKWLNSIVIEFANNNLPEEIFLLPFVKEVQVVKKPTVNKSSINKFTEPLAKSAAIRSDTSIYGESSHQVFQLNTQFLHNQNYRGQGMLIAVLDAGFYAVDNYPAFDSLRTEGRISGIRDFVDGDQLVYNEHHHGMSVLSVMAGNIPGQLIGTAPQASYWLLRTEDASSEYLIEEDNWVAAAEFADSAGVDIINSSLGYSTFDDPTMDHTYADMDGNTTLITRGANVAASRGIIVFSSAGNEGSENNPWKYILAPSDGDKVTAVGAVDKEGNPAPFSSWGPASDGDVKPNVSAVGWNTIVQRTNGTVGTANGTSFSSPVMAGAAACLWQANPKATAADIKKAIEQSAHRYSSPDPVMGYGIPDLMAADSILKSAANGSDQIEKVWLAYPNPAASYLIIRKHKKSTGQKLWLSVYTPDGRLVYKEVKTDDSKIILSNLQQLPKGLLFLHLRSGNDTDVLKILNSP